MVLPPLARPATQTKSILRALMGENDAPLGPAEDAADAAGTLFPGEKSGHRGGTGIFSSCFFDGAIPKGRLGLQEVISGRSLFDL